MSTAPVPSCRMYCRAVVPSCRRAVVPSCRMYCRAVVPSCRTTGPRAVSHYRPPCRIALPAPVPYRTTGPRAVSHYVYKYPFIAYLYYGIYSSYNCYIYGWIAISTYIPVTIHIIPRKIRAFLPVFGTNGPFIPKKPQKQPFRAIFRAYAQVFERFCSI
jgi:hypothetical protein